MSMWADDDGSAVYIVLDGDLLRIPLPAARK
jgi:hypothetical protein